VRGKRFQEQLAGRWGDDLDDLCRCSYKTIDQWDSAKGHATSIKTYDLTAKSYRQGSALSRNLRRDVNSLAGFTGERARGAAAAIGAGDINLRRLVIVVPKGSVGLREAKTIVKAAMHARRQGVHLVVKRL
jgi:hypothetical protein